MPDHEPKPRVFIGSSSEGLKIAQALQALLEGPCEVAVWNQGIFGPTTYILDGLKAVAKSYDFAILILSGDDKGISRDSSYVMTRDNVILECGFFLGMFGRDRTFIVYDSLKNPKIPTDLAGLVLLDFKTHQNGNFQSSLGKPSTNILTKIFEIYNDLRDLQLLPIRITHPTTNDRIAIEMRSGAERSSIVTGTLPHLPAEHQIWLLVGHANAAMVWPQAPVQYNPIGGIWEGTVVLVDQKSVTIYAVVAPPLSQQFFEYYRHVGKRVKDKTGKDIWEPLIGIPSECSNMASVTVEVPPFY